jgi:hypothetical protein
MKVPSSLIPIALLFVLFSCNDDSMTDMGSSIQPAGDKIIVASETFNISSENYFVPSIFARQDSFLLGTFYDETYGTTHADIFTQVEHPANHVYPANTVPDSIILVMYYRKFFGDKYSPMNVSVYEMNKATFEYTTAYPSNIKPEDYVDRSNSSLLIGQRTFSPVDALGIRDSTYITIKLTDAFRNRFANINADTYSSDEKFLNFFKGLYITTDFGSASMLYVKQIDMEYYHHYTYPTKGVFGQDSTATVKSVINFAANKWVRQVNRFLHPDTTAIKNKLAAASPQIHYISSPANVYTRVILPIKTMHDSMEVNDKRLTINSAKLRVDISEINTDVLAPQITSSILLIKESEYSNFFKKKAIPSNTTAIIGTYSYQKNSETEEYEYFYSFDIANMIANEFKNSKTSGIALSDNEKFLLVPVRVTSDSNGNVTEVTQQFLLSAVTLCGGNHTTRPIKARVVYSSF